MKQITAFKFACVGAFVATLGVGCASSGYARYDDDSTDMNRGMGVSAGADVGSASASVDADTSIRTDSNQIRTDVDSPTIRTDIDTPSVRTDIDTDIDTDRDLVVTDRDDTTMTMTDTEGEERITVSALALNPETRATWVNRFPFYDTSRQLRTIDVYTFAVPDPGADIEVSTRASDAPDFRADLPSGSVFVEAAGGAGEVRTGRVIQHSPNPTR